MSMVDQPQPQVVSKRLREERLHWQSSLVMVTVISLAIFYLGLDCYLAYPSRAALTALCVGAVFAVIVWRLRAATPLAAIAGGVLTADIYFSSVGPVETSWLHSGIVPLMTLFILTYTATRYRRKTKERRGTAEPKRGRNAAQVCANLGVAALFHAPLISPSLYRITSRITRSMGSMWLVPMLAALAEATADTVSSEVGQVLGGMPRMITTLKPVPPGTDGAISLAGTAAGCVAGAVVVCVGAVAMDLEIRTAAVAFASGIFGLFFDSLLGATLERRGYLNNDAVNFLSTLAAAVAAGLIAYSQQG